MEAGCPNVNPVEGPAAAFPKGLAGARLEEDPNGLAAGLAGSAGLDVDAPKAKGAGEEVELEGAPKKNPDELGAGGGVGVAASAGLGAPKLNGLGAAGSVLLVEGAPNEKVDVDGAGAAGLSVSVVVGEAPKEKGEDEPAVVDGAPKEKPVAGLEAAAGTAGIAGSDDGVGETGAAGADAGAPKAKGEETAGFVEDAPNEKVVDGAAEGVGKGAATGAGVEAGAA